MAAEQINMHTLLWNPYPEAEVETAQVTAVSARGSRVVPEKCSSVCVCVKDGWVSVYTDLGGFVAWCASIHPHNTHTHPKMVKWSSANTQRASTWKRNDISMCPCHLTLSAYQNSLQRKAAVGWVAMKSRHDPQIVGANMKALRKREGGGRARCCKSERMELSTNWNGSRTGLHNLRLTRKQQRMKPPSFSPPFSSAVFWVILIKKVSEAVL